MFWKKRFQANRCRGLVAEFVLPKIPSKIAKFHPQIVENRLESQSKFRTSLRSRLRRGQPSAALQASSSRVAPLSPMPLSLSSSRLLTNMTN